MAASMTSTGLLDPGDDDAESDIDQGALRTLLEDYPKEQLVKEIVTAWDMISAKDKEVSKLRRRRSAMNGPLPGSGVVPAAGTRPRRAQPAAPEAIRDNSMLGASGGVSVGHAREARPTFSAASSLRQLETDNRRLQQANDEQARVIAELQGKLDQVVDALEQAAEAGLSSFTTEQAGFLEAGLADAQWRIGSLESEAETLRGDRERLRDIVERLRGALDHRERRIVALEERIEQVQLGPPTVSAEHDYLLGQVEDLKRRLLERNREYEALKRRERRLHREVFERDERVQQLQLTIIDMEQAMQDRMAELRSLEEMLDRNMGDLQDAQKSSKRQEVMGRMFVESLGIARDQAGLEQRRERYSGMMRFDAPSPEVAREAARRTLEQRGETTSNSLEEKFAAAREGMHSAMEGTEWDGTPADPLTPGIEPSPAAPVAVSRPGTTRLPSAPPADEVPLPPVAPAPPVDAQAPTAPEQSPSIVDSRLRSSLDVARTSAIHRAKQQMHESDLPPRSGPGGSAPPIVFDDDDDD